MVSAPVGVSGRYLAAIGVAHVQVAVLALDHRRVAVPAQLARWGRLIVFRVILCTTNQGGKQFVQEAMADSRSS